MRSSLVFICRALTRPNFTKRILSFQINPRLMATSPGQETPSPMEEDAQIKTDESDPDGKVTDVNQETSSPSSKRPAEDLDLNQEHNDAKKIKTEEEPKEVNDDKEIKSAGQQEVKKYDRPFYKKKKAAVCAVYSGKGYTGMQMNPGMKTIERDLLEAFCKAGVITEQHKAEPSKQMNFMRGARTDKGVSAGGQIVSLKMFVDVPDAVAKINSHLVDQIRVIGYKTVTRGFSSKDSCSNRTYMYLLPTFAFTPVEEFVTEDYRMPEDVRTEVNRILAMYKGTHNFHNFTSGRKPNDPSAQRYIIDMNIGEPFLEENVEYAVIKVKGQSFMLHQIRKMIGLVIAIVRGLASEKSMTYAWRPERADVPIAPGLGLLLDQLHYDAYNQRYGTDGIHEPLTWDEYKDEVEAFKHKHIYSTIFETEKKEKSMMKWLKTLHYHHFEPKKTTGPISAESPLGKAEGLLKADTDAKASSETDGKGQSNSGGDSVSNVEPSDSESSAKEPTEATNVATKEPTEETKVETKEPTEETRVETKEPTEETKVATKETTEETTAETAL